MHGCGQCGGVWLDNASSQRLTNALCDHTVSLADKIGRAAPGAPHQGPAHCPVCQHQLRVTRVSRAQVEIDVCDSHGAWFDRDELQTVARAFAVDRAYLGPNAAAVGVGAAAVGAGALGAAAVAQDPSIAQRAQRAVEEHGGTAAEVGVEALDFVDAGDVAEGAGIAAEAAGGIAEGAFELLGGIFSSLG